MRTTDAFVIYHFGSFAAFMQILVLRLKKHKDKKAVLIAADNNNRENGNKKELILKFKDAGLFDEIIFFPSNLAYQKETEPEVLDEINSFFNNVFKCHNINIRDAHNIYTFDSFRNALAIHLDYYNIKCIWGEHQPNDFKATMNYCAIGKGILSESFYNLHRKVFPLDDEGMLYKPIIAFPETNNVKESSLIERCNFYADLKTLDDKDKQVILNCFGIKDELIKFLQSNETSMLLTNSNSYIIQLAEQHYNMRKNNFIPYKKTTLSGLQYSQETINYLYALLCDYYMNVKSKIMCSDHPYAETDFSLIFDEVTLLDANVLMELLLLMPNVKLSQTISIATTAVKNLSPIIKQNISLGNEFVSAFYFYNKLYVGLRIANDLNAIMAIMYYGVETGVIEKMMFYLFDDHLNKSINKIYEVPSYKENNCYIINTSQKEFITLTDNEKLLTALEEASDECIVIFINGINEYCFCDLEKIHLLKFIVPITIKKTPIKDKALGSMDDEVIYVFTKSKLKRRKLEQLTFSKKLHYCGMLLNIVAMSKDEMELEYQKCAVLSRFIQPFMSIYKTQSKLASDELNRTNKILADMQSFNLYITDSPFYKYALTIIKAGRLLRKIKRKIMK